MNCKSNNFSSFLIVVFCLLVVLGCRDIYDSGERPSSTSKEKTSEPAVKNPFIGKWKGKAFDGATDLEMIFTETEWTLISGGENVMTRPYKIKGGNSVEITTKEGTILPMDIYYNGDSISASTKKGKTTLYRE